MLLMIVDDIKEVKTDEKKQNNKSKYRKKRAVNMTRLTSVARKTLFFDNKCTSPILTKVQCRCKKRRSPILFFISLHSARLYSIFCHMYFHLKWLMSYSFIRFFVCMDISTIFKYKMCPRDIGVLFILVVLASDKRKLFEILVDYCS
jgi:hypothetical protein